MKKTRQTKIKVEQSLDIPEAHLDEEIIDTIAEYWAAQIHTLSKPSCYQDATTEVSDHLSEKLATWGIHIPQSNLEVRVAALVAQHSPQRYTITTDNNIPHAIITDDHVQEWKRHVAQLLERDANNPKQGTQAWLRQRYDMITASDVYKAITTPAQLASLVKAKSLPLVEYGLPDEEREEGTVKGGPAPMAWGHMFEPMSVKIYEHLTGEKVLNMGCLSHPEYPFLGASPDGVIAPSEEGLRHRRLLEIKNPISRVIDGVPSEPYWVQKQIQMEVLDMEGCDFLETQFKTGSEQEWRDLMSNNGPNWDAVNAPMYFGVIGEYVRSTWGEPVSSKKHVYSDLYCPFEQPKDSPKNLVPILNEESREPNGSPTTPPSKHSEHQTHLDGKWDEDNCDTNLTDVCAANISTETVLVGWAEMAGDLDRQFPSVHPTTGDARSPYKLSQKIYWWLESCSLVLVPRNREWFASVLPRIQHAWRMIEAERAKQAANRAQFNEEFGDSRTYWM